MKYAWMIGSAFGIPVLVHWSFLLILGWAGYRGYEAGGWSYLFFMLILTLLLFGCVLLHELGHSLMARRFGIHTRSIMLLPIGGVAALDSLPRRPSHELLVAVAGPMVNVVIAGLIFILFDWPENVILSDGSWDMTSLVGMLFYVNVVMVLFNLIPAFPMDGGRMLRAFLAMKVSYLRATVLASWIGQVLAVGMVVSGLRINPFLSIIGLVIFWGARREREAVQQRFAMAGWAGESRRPFMDIG